MGVMAGEKRHLKRIALRTPIRYQTRGRPDFSETLSDDISLGGIGLTENKFISPKTIVMLEINILARMLRPVGKIAWAAALPHSGKYRIGIEFLEFSPDEKHYLAGYINMHLANQKEGYNGN